MDGMSAALVPGRAVEHARSLPASSLSVREAASRPIGLSVLLQRDDGRVLLLRAVDGMDGDGRLAPPSGVALCGESLVEAALREVHARVGVVVDAGWLEFCQLIDTLSGFGTSSLGVAFTAQRWHRDPYNREPHRCARLVWVDPGAPPRECAPHARSLLAGFVRGSLLATQGYELDARPGEN